MQIMTKVKAKSTSVATIISKPNYYACTELQSKQVLLWFRGCHTTFSRHSPNGLRPNVAGEHHLHMNFYQNVMIPYKYMSIFTVKITCYLMKYKIINVTLFMSV